jgi:hypothetical protein
MLVATSGTFNDENEFFPKFSVELSILFSILIYCSWLERLAVDAKDPTVLGSIPESFDTVESEGRQMKQC